MTGEVTTTSVAGEPRAITRVGTHLVLASALASTLGILIAQFLDDLGDGLAAELLGGSAVLYNNRVEISGASDIAWAGGFVLCLIVGFLVLFAYPTAREQGLPRLALLWTLLHLLRQALSQAIFLPFDADGQLARAYSTLDAPPGLDLVIAAAGGVGLLLVALSAASAFLAYAPHRRLVSDARKRANFVLWVVVVPAVASVFLAIPFFLPDTQSLVIPALPLTALMFLATLAAAPGTTTVSVPDDAHPVTLPWGLVATLAVALVLYVTVLAGGVSVDPRLWGQI